MKKGTKIKLGIAGLAIAGIVGYVVWRKKKNYSLGAGGESVASGGSKPRFPLTQGSGMGDKTYQQADVKIVQKALNNTAPAPMARLDVDGKFGAKTAAMLDMVHKTKQVNEDLFNKLKAQA